MPNFSLFQMVARLQGGYRKHAYQEWKFLRFFDCLNYYYLCNVIEI